MDIDQIPLCAGRFNGHSCALPEFHESRHQNRDGDLYWDHELIPDGKAYLEIQVGSQFS